MKTIEELRQLAQDANDGNESALLAYIEIKRAADELAALQESVKQAAINEASREDEKSFEKHGAKIQYREGSGRWKFDHLQDWSQAYDAMKEIEDRHKAAYQVWKRGGTYVDPETGEAVEPAGYIDGAPTISVSIPKAR